jgi:predicted DNA-binding transcriptional regulator
LKNFSRADGAFDFLDTQNIFNHWNELFADVQGVPKHKSLTSKVIKNAFGRYFTLAAIISETLRNYSVDEIKDAITLYHDTLTDESHFYNHKYSLAEFLHYGNRNGTGYMYFLNKPKKPYKKTTEDVVESIRKLFKPVTEEWDKDNILDTNRQTYYGFSMDSIKNWKSRKFDVDLLLKIFSRGGIKIKGKLIPKTDWEFSDKWQLELAIAGMLYHRKELNQELRDDLKKYFLIWQKLMKGVTKWTEMQ